MRFPLTLCVLGLASVCAADVEITPDSGGFQVKTASYEAQVSDRGGLTTLKVGAADFVEGKNSFAMASYFYQEGGLPLNPPAKLSDTALRATGPKGEAHYAFADGSFEIKATNLTDKPIVYFVIVNRKADAVRGPRGTFVGAPVTEGWSEATWFQGKAKLQITGFTKLWGPWENGSQVVELDIAASQTATLKLTPAPADAAEIAQAAKAARPTKLTEGDLIVYSPKTYQVFQRSGLYTGQVVVAGRVRVPADKVEVRLSGRSLKGALPAKWQPVTLNPVDGSFQAQIATVPGGWYKAEIRALKRKSVVANATVDKVGLGEVFVGAGQSNSTNCGQEKTKQTSGMVSSFSGTDWRIADDPQPGPHDNSQGGSFWPAFGDAMVARYKVPIGVAVTGHGGTSVNQWQPGGELLTWTATRMNQLGVGGFRGVLWHQGESDAGIDPELYVELMTNVIVTSKQMAGWDFPWFVARVSYHNPDKPRHENIRTAHKLLWDRGIAMEGPDTDTLTGDNRDWNGAGVHFSPKGLKAHGRMWMEKVSLYLDKVLGIKR